MDYVKWMRKTKYIIIRAGDNYLCICSSSLVYEKVFLSIGQPIFMAK